MFEILSILFLFLCVILLAGISLVAMLAYRNGFKDGMSVANKKEIPPLENPTIKLFTKKEEKEEKEEDKILQGLNNLMTYDGNTP